MNENDVQAKIRLTISKRGWRMWRNNVGVLRNPDTGRPVRFGLANDSPKTEVASADLIGIMPLVIGPEHIGATVGVFASIECKRSDVTKLGNTKHETAQRAWRDLVRSLGGYAIITNGDTEL